jgi:O-antigen/teichoic acid export membrane protein
VTARTLTRTLNNLRQRYCGESRGGRLRLSVATGVFARAAQLLSGLLIVPLAVRYLGNDGYGLFVTITAVVTWLQVSTFGVGAGLQNALTEAVAAGDTARQRSLISTAFVFLVTVTAVLGIGLAASFSALPWTRIFPAADTALAAQVAPTVAIVLTGFVSTFALAFVNSIYAARQQLQIPNYAAIATALLTVAGTVLAVYLDLGLVGLTAATVGSGAVVAWGFSIGYLLAPSNRDFRPSLRGVTRAAWARIFRSSSAFFVIQICSMALFQSDYFIIAHFAAVDDVTPYSVANKPFNILSTLILAAVIHPLWAAYGNAKACADIEWIQRNHRRVLLIFMGLYGSAFVAMLLIGRPLLSLWVGADAAPTTALIAATGCYYLIRQWTDLHSGLVNGLDMIWPQAFSAIIHALITVALELWLIRSLGVIGVPLACFLGYALVSAWFLPLLAQRSLRVLNAQAQPPPAAASASPLMP